MAEVTEPLLSIIVVSFNTKELTLKALNSAIKDINRSPHLKNNTELIVIDNNSDDGSVAAIEKLSPQTCQLKLIKNQKNVGFAQANNQGINQSRGEYLFLLNTDAIVQPQCLHQLISSFQKFSDNAVSAQLSSYHGKLDKLGILAARLKNKNDSVQPQGGSFPNLCSLANHMLLLDDLPLIGKLLPSTQHTGLRFNLKNPNREKLIKKDWVGGTAMMIKRAVIDEIGLFDPNIFMYGEDIEFCLRAQNHHWDVALDPQAEVIHLGSASSNSEQALLGEIKGYLYIWAKHKPHWQMFLVKFLIWTGCWLRIFLFTLIDADNKKVKTYKQALTLLA